MLRSGTYRWFRAYAAPRLASDGSVLRWYGTLEDIHDRKLAKAGLRQSIAFARSNLDGSPDLVTVLDLEGCVRSLGRRAMERLREDVASRILGRPWADTWPKAHRAAVKQAVAHAREGTGHRFSGICPDREGADTLWDITVEPVRNGDGTITHILVISRDVSKQERMRREVNAARSQVAEMLESTTDCVIVVDSDFRITYIIPHARNFVGRTSTLKVGGSSEKLIPSTSRPTGGGV
jgi:PAS domain S-box-containing protein